ncbi:RNA polymerase sigma factor [Niabella aurantiaca]|uniref:RNA polymerase sigma factor n=1 Tax=Niabella aurantiaca TaxID=379900 RepID=UPI000363222E|nr:sigma-70 family RNA polymerase sigma factor [Niabella aurantiaca]
MEEITGELIDRFNNGYPAAFTSLYHQFYPAVFFYVKKMVTDTAQAEDITAETFIKFWNNRGRFENGHNIAAFLRVTAKNASIDWLRKSKKYREGANSLARLSNTEMQVDLHEDIRAEVLRLVQTEIDRLPPKIKKVFMLAYLYEKSNEEIAAILGIQNQSVRNHKARALKLLRLSLTGKGMLVFCSFYVNWGKV